MISLFFDGDVVVKSFGLNSTIPRFNGSQLLAVNSEHAEGEPGNPSC